MNLPRFHHCFPIKTKKIAIANADIDDDMITVNNFFVHWIKEINIKNMAVTNNWYQLLLPMKSINTLIQC